MSKESFRTSKPMTDGQFKAFADKNINEMLTELDGVGNAQQFADPLENHTASTSRPYERRISERPLTTETSRPEPRRYRSPERIQSARDRGGNKLKKAVAMAAIAGVGLVGGSKLASTLDEAPKAHFEKIERTALSEVERAWNNVAVLHEGVTYRTAPKTVNAEKEEGPNTVAGKIPEGNLIRINNPLVYVEELPSGDTNTWFGFTLGDEVTADTANIYWANYSELNNQQENGKPLVSVYDYEEIAKSRQEHPKQQFDPSYDVSINPGEPVQGAIGSKGSLVADGHIVSSAEFERDIQQEGLVNAYK